MPYFSDLHTYLHRSSQLIQAYPSARITTKYSLPKKVNPKPQSKSDEKKDAAPEPTETTGAQSQPRRERSAVLTLKTYHAESGICLKYKTDKAAEVGRLLAGLGRLAKGELIDLPTVGTISNGAAAGNDPDKMDIDSGVVAAELDAKVVTAAPAATQTAGKGGGGKTKKKKGKK